MQNTTIEWTCTSAAQWEWLSIGPKNPGVPVGGDNLQMTGTISLPPNQNYWYPCVSLLLPGDWPGIAMGTVGNAGLQCSLDASGNPQVNVMTVAQGNWTSYGQPGRQSQTDQTGASGGISLFAKIVG